MNVSTLPWLLLTAGLSFVGGAVVGLGENGTRCFVVIDHEASTCVMDRDVQLVSEGHNADILAEGFTFKFLFVK